jgi:hypothetical protein
MTSPPAALSDLTRVVARSHFLSKVSLVLLLCGITLSRGVNTITARIQAMSSENNNDYDHRQLIKTTLAPRLVAEPLKTKIETELESRSKAPAGAEPAAKPYEVIIELNLNRQGGRSEARASIIEILRRILAANADAALARNEPDSTHPYIFANLTADQINALVLEDGKNAQELGAGGEASQAAAEAKLPPQSDPASTSDRPPDHSISYRRLRSIFRIWESQKVRPLTTVSIQTVKANAAHNSFRALGGGDRLGDSRFRNRRIPSPFSVARQSHIAVPADRMLQMFSWWGHPLE